MGRRKGISKKQKPAPRVSEPIDSDEEVTKYKDNPDPKDSAYFLDTVEQFNEKRGKRTLDKFKKSKKRADNSEEEILPLESDDSDFNEDGFEELKKKYDQFCASRRQLADEDLTKDLEGELGEGDSETEGWGKEKSAYYGEQEDEEDSSGEEAEEEEQEALALQQKLAQQLDEEDFDLGSLQVLKELNVKEDKILDVDDDEQQIERDLSSMTKDEKLQLVISESPELLVILDDVKEKIQELERELVPLMLLIKNKKINTKGSGIEYVRTRFHLILNYSMNVNFYLILKSQRVDVKNHPVIKRLIEYKQLIQDLDAVREMLLPEIELLLKQVDDSGVVKSKERKLLSILKKKKPLQEKTPIAKSIKRKLDEPEETLAEKKVKFAAANKKEKPEQQPSKKTKQTTPVIEDEDDQYSGNESVDDGPGDEESRERRAISRQILKNRGLTPHRAKKYGNPRVKNRSKYDKAVKKWKTQVPPARREIDRYGGEKSGIRAGIVKSVKIK